MVMMALFRSIRTRIMTATTLLILSIVGTMVWLWAVNESHRYRKQTEIQAQTLATALANALTNELVRQNWSQIRTGLDLMMSGNEDFVYIFVSDHRLHNQIVAASPPQFQEQYIPDVVKAEITQTALSDHAQPYVQETWILRDIEFPRGIVRAYRGTPLLEVAAEMRNSEQERIGTFRLGISLLPLRQAITNLITKALMVGAAGLGFGLLGSYILARQLSQPVRKLQLSAAKIARGDLCHRADIDLADEIGALATSFNEMSFALQSSFSRLEKMVEAFQRFVPAKFLSVIASEGIENIQVGVASKKTMTILFADIRNYTTMSENLTPIETYLFLNDYLAAMGEAISGAGGFIDKYIGDAIMALFDDEATDGVLKAAIAMRHSLKLFNEKRHQQGLPTVNIGIGIHRGEVIMGTVGFTSRMESTVIGDAVNIASRVEELTKNYGGSATLMTEPIISGLGHPEDFQFHLLDQFVKVKGKEQPLVIYQLEI